ncbi:MAG: mandelate racemase/muconate lactonizing enzyme family protein [Chloroflexota bacterium]
MKVTSIKPFICDGGFRPWTFVKVETDAGITGWGDCTDWGGAPAVAATVEHYGQFVIGRDPHDVEAIWWGLYARNIRHVGGIASKAMSGIDSALWDIKGKDLGVPVWKLLGGKMRDSLRLYWSHCGSNRAQHADKLGLTPVRTTDDLRRLAEEVLARGFTAVKTNMFPLQDRPDAMPEADAAGDLTPSTRRNIEAIVGTFRDTLGPDAGIALDVALRFRLGAAVKVAQALEPFDMMWLETETFDAAVLRTVRESTCTTICTGESLFGTYGYRPFLEQHAQDIIMPDFAWNGITMGRKICDLAQAYDTFVAPHNCHSPLTTLISANICAAIPNFKILEFDQDDAPWRDDIMTHPPEIHDGRLKVPDRPGLGSDLIESELAKRPYVHHAGVR